MLKRAAFVAAVLAVMAIAGGVDKATATAVPDHCTAQEFAPFSAAVWSHDLWERGALPRVIHEAESRRLGCAPPAHRRTMKRIWRHDQRTFYAHRLYRRLNPYYGCTTFGGCRFYALPAYIVDCESGGDYTPSVGALTFGGMYGILISTWQQFGGSTYAANEGSPREQDRIAGIVWATVGSGGWECA